MVMNNCLVVTILKIICRIVLQRNHATILNIISIHNIVGSGKSDRNLCPLVVDFTRIEQSAAIQARPSEILNNYESSS